MGSGRVQVEGGLATFSRRRAVTCLLKAVQAQTCLAAGLGGRWWSLTVGLHVQTRLFFFLLLFPLKKDLFLPPHIPPDQSCVGGTFSG